MQLRATLCLFSLAILQLLCHAHAFGSSPGGAGQNIEGDDSSLPNVVMQSVVLGKRGVIHEIEPNNESSLDYLLRKLIHLLVPNRCKRHNEYDNSHESTITRLVEVLGGPRRRRKRDDEEEEWDHLRHHSGENRHRRNTFPKKHREDEAADVIEEYLNRRQDEGDDSKKWKKSKGHNKKDWGEEGLEDKSGKSRSSDWDNRSGGAGFWDNLRDSWARRTPGFTYLPPQFPLPATPRQNFHTYP